MCAFVQDELDGLCESPHDDPAQWALMLTAYFDESFQSGNAYIGHTVMAGFYGTKESWQECASQWKSGLDTFKKKSLHMKDLRWKGNRNKELLRHFGAIPHNAGLRPAFSSLRIADYDIAPHIPRRYKSGYFLSLVAATSAVLIALPKGQRLEVIFEEQIQFSDAREGAMSVLRKIKDYKGRNGRSALAKWSSSPKSMLLQPSDYLAYAILQTLIDPLSLKAQLCKPILEQGVKRIGGRMTEKQVSRIVPLAKDYVVETKSNMVRFKR